MVDQQKAQEQYKQLQALQENIQQLQKHMEVIEQQIIELMGFNQDLDSLKTVKKGAEILVPISSGVFAKAIIGDPNDLIVNVGASTLTKKDIPDVRQLMEKQIEDLKQLQQKMLEDLKKMVEQASALEMQLKTLLEK